MASALWSLFSGWCLSCLSAWWRRHGWCMWWMVQSLVIAPIHHPFNHYLVLLCVAFLLQEIICWSVHLLIFGGKIILFGLGWWKPNLAWEARRWAGLKRCCTVSSYYPTTFAKIMHGELPFLMAFWRQKWSPNAILICTKNWISLP